MPTHCNLCGLDRSLTMIKVGNDKQPQWVCSHCRQMALELNEFLKKKKDIKKFEY